MCKTVKFKSDNNQFLKKLQDDVKRIKENNEILINADKSQNIYKIDKTEYQQFLNNSITTSYKKQPQRK